MNNLKKRLRSWKPIHLCWLFDKYGLPIPRYLIGGGDAPPQYEGSRISDGVRAWIEDEDVDVTDWVIGEDFCISVAWGAQAGKKCNARELRLRWRNVTDIGTFADLSGSGELTWSADTSLVNDDPLTQGESGLVASQATYDNGIEREGANAYTYPSFAADEWQAGMWAIDTDNALAGKVYEFELYNIDDGVQVGVTVQITMAAGAIQAISGTILATASLPTPELKRRRDMNPLVISASASLPSPTLRRVKALAGTISALATVPAVALRRMKALAGIIDASSITGDNFSGDLSKWTQQYGTWAISSGEVERTDTGQNGVLTYSFEPTFGINHWAKAKITRTGGSDYPGLLLRLDPGETRCYGIEVNGTDVYWYRLNKNTGVGNLIASTALAHVSGNTLGARVSGIGSDTVVEVWNNPSGDSPDDWGAPDVIFTDDPAGNNADTGKYVGLVCWQAAGSNCQFDDFSGGSPSAVVAGDLKVLRGLAGTIKAGLAGRIFSADLEEGDLSDFESSLGGEISASASAAHRGNYGILIDVAAADWSDQYVYENNAFTEKKQANFRFYVRFANSFAMPSGDFWRLFAGWDDAWSACNDLNIYYDGSDYYLGLRQYTDLASIWLPGFQGGGWLCNGIIDGEWHCIEIHFATCEPGEDSGQAELWVDGVLRGSSYTLDNDTLRFGMFRLGLELIDTETGVGEIHIDSVEIDDSGYIGLIEEFQLKVSRKLIGSIGADSAVIGVFKASRKLTGLISASATLPTPVLKRMKALSGLIGFPEIFGDPGLEVWNTPTDLAYWIEVIGGTNTVNRDGVEQRSGTYCVRLDVDSDEDDCSFATQLDLGASLHYIWEGWSKSSDAIRYGSIFITDSGFNVFWDGTKWSPTAAVAKFLPTGTSWQKWSIPFKTHPSYTLYNIYHNRYYNAGGSFYYDDVSLKRTNSWLEASIKVSRGLTGTISAFAQLVGDVSVLGTVALNGIISASASLPTPVLKVRKELVGTISASATFIGDVLVKGTKWLQGVILATANLPTPDLKRRRDMNPLVISAQATVPTAILGRLRKFVGIVNAVATVPVVDMDIFRGLAGAINAQSTVPVAEMKRRRDMAPQVISAVATLPTPILKIRKSLIGTISALATIPTTALKRLRKIAGTIEASFTIPAPILKVRKALAGIISATAQFIGDVNVLGAVVLSGIIEASATLPAPVLKVRKEIAGTISASASLPTIALRRIRKLTPNVISASATFYGTVERIKALVGVILATAEVSGAIKRTRRLYADIILASATLSATMRRRRSLIGTINVTAMVYGLAKRARGLAGTIEASATMIGIIGRLKGLAGTIIASATLYGAFGRVKKLVGTIIASAEFSGMMKTIKGFVGTISATATLIGDLSVKLKYILLSGVISATSTVSGSMKAIRGLIGTIVATATLSGRLFDRITVTFEFFIRKTKDFTIYIRKIFDKEFKV